MGKSLLVHISDSVKRYARVISEVLDMDVDIADYNLIRVAGTGRFGVNIDEPFGREGNAFKRVMETKKPLYIRNSSEDEICVGCANLDVCAGQGELCCPIMLNGEVLGVISLATSNDEQRERIERGYQNYENFLQNIAELIASKAQEYLSMEEMKNMVGFLYKLMDLINDGVIVMDSDNKLLYLNRKTEIILGHNLKQLMYLEKINKFAIHRVKALASGELEYLARIYNKKISLVGQLYPISFLNREAKVFIFRDMETIKKSYLSGEVDENVTFDSIVGESEAFIRVKRQCETMASLGVNMLICGEPGTGKEMFARAVHNSSTMHGQPFIAMPADEVNALFDSEEYVKEKTPEGIAKLFFSNFPMGGTIYINEVGNLALRHQNTLMNIMRLRPEKFRFIFSSTKDLRKAVESGEFSEDLYYSLEVASITIPPLRMRKDDIPLLTRNLLAKYNVLENKNVSFKKSVYTKFLNYNWLGNITELENIVSFLVMVSEDKASLEFSALPQSIQNKLNSFGGPGQFNLERIERETILSALNLFGNSAESKKRVAEELGIGKATLYRKLKKYKIQENVNYTSGEE